MYIIKDYIPIIVLFLACFIYLVSIAYLPPFLPRKGWFFCYFWTFQQSSSYRGNQNHVYPFGLFSAPVSLKGKNSLGASQGKGTIQVSLYIPQNLLLTFCLYYQKICLYSALLTYYGLFLKTRSLVKRYDLLCNDRVEKRG